MSRILAIRVKGVLIAVSFSEITRERAEGHTVHFRVTRPICALDVHRKFSACPFVDECQIRIKILLRAQLNFESVRLSKFNEHREKEQFEHFGNYFCVHGNGVNAAVHIDESFDNPFTFVCGNAFANDSAWAWSSRKNCSLVMLKPLAFPKKSSDSSLSKSTTTDFLGCLKGNNFP
jgi:hypothetical protein